MHYVKHFDIDGVATRQAACIELHGKPNAATEGCVGVLGIDVDSPKREVYKCVAVNGNIYTWELLSVSALVETNSVVKYGAVGDGRADDTAAFKAALATERVVSVPGGIYKLSDGLVVRENCMLELAQDAVLEFTQTSGNAITLLRLANIKGNHATVNVPYTFSGNVINCDTGDDEAHLGSSNLAEANATAVPPFKKWSPQWKMSRYVTDINICKPNASGFHYSDDGACYGTAVYMGCSEGIADYMWGVSMSGLRVAGGFTYGIHMECEGATWNHDMRIEAVIDSCETAVFVDNTHFARLAVTIQPRSAADGTKYAKHGIKIKDSRCTDLSSSRVWDWDANNTLWTEGGEYQHIALYGECKGLVLDDYLYYIQPSYDIRELIYTDTASNLEKMTILQEPITRWFKPVDGVPYFSDGFTEKKLITQDELDNHFDTDVVKGFTDVLAQAIDTDGSVYNGIGYKMGGFLTTAGVFTSSSYYGSTGFIPCKQGSQIYAHDLSFAVGDDNCRIVLFDADFNYIFHVNRGLLVAGDNYYVGYAETDGGFVCTINSVNALANVAYARFSVYKTQWGTHPMMAIDEEIKYTVEGFLANSVKVKVENVVGLNPDGSFDASGFVKSVNGNTPDENGNVEIDLPDDGGHFVEGAGELVFSHTATFATDSEATLGVPVPGVSVVATLNAVYWLEVNGEMLKCHWEKDSSSSGMVLNTRILYDEGRNEWVRSMSGNVMVYAQTAGTYTFTLYAPSDEFMLDPKYIPSNLARKFDIKDSFDVNISAVDGYSCSTPVSTLETLLDTDRRVVAKITTDTGVLFAQLCSYETSADNSHGHIVMFALGALTFTLTPTSSGSYEVTVSGD